MPGKKAKYVRFTISLPEQELERLKEKAEEETLPVSTLARIAIREWLKAQEQRDQGK